MRTNMQKLTPTVQKALAILDQAGYLPPNSIKLPTPATPTTPRVPGTVETWTRELASKDFSPINIEQGTGIILSTPRPPTGIALGDLIEAVKQARRENVDRIPWQYKNPPADLPEQYGIDYQRALLQMAARHEPNYHQLATQYAQQIAEKEKELSA